MSEQEHNPAEDTELDEEKPEKWVYKKTKKVEKSDYTLAQFFKDFISYSMLTAFFAILPVITTIGVGWLVYHLLKMTLYTEDWVQPLILFGGAFFAGAFARTMMGGFLKTMGLMMLSLISFSAYAFITYLDIQNSGGIYSRFMPDIIPYSLQTFVPALPLVGMAGLLLFDFFTIKQSK